MTGTSALPDPPVRPDTTAGTDPPSHAEVAVLGAVALVALGSWVSLAMAHAGTHSGLAVAAVTSGLAVVAVGALARSRRGVPSLRRDPAGLAVAGLVVAVAVVLSWPGFPYGLADKDPGVYVAHGQAIARTGSYELTDPVIEAGVPRGDFSPGARYPGIWIADEAAARVVPQFFHLYPAALATADDLAGTTGLVNFNVGVAALSAAALALAVRRGVGRAAGTIAGLLLATSFLQVWHAKYPTTEMLTQMLFVGATLGVVVALGTGLRAPAGLAGMLAGLTFLARPDSVFLLVVVAGVGAAVAALRRWDRRVTWFAVGFGLTVPHGAWQAYVTADRYARNVGVPGGARFALLLAALAAGVVVWWRWLGARVERLVGDLGVERSRRLTGAVVAAAGGVLVAAGFARPWLLGEAMLDYNGRLIRSFDEDNLVRLSWFFTVPGVVLAAAGLAVVSLERWRARAWALVVPFLVIAPVYLSKGRVAPRMMWASRRWLPVVVVGIVVLVAVVVGRAVEWDGRWRDRVRGAGLLVAAGLVAFGAQQSWDLRGHDELTGSFEIVDELSALSAGRESVYLWEPPEPDGGPHPDTFHPSRVLGGPLWLRTGHASTILPARPTPADLDRYRRAFPGARLFVVARSGRPPITLETVPMVPVLAVDRALPLWEETLEERPDAPISIPMTAHVFEVAG